MRATLALLLLGCPGQHARPMPAPEAPSVLVIVLDDVGWPEAPSLPSVFGPGGLAERGVTFERCYSAPLCSPSRLMMLAGLYPRRVGLGGNLSPFDPALPPLPDLVTMPDLFSPTHATALFGKWHLGWAESWQGRDLIISGPPTQGFQRWIAGNPATPSLGPGASGYRDWIRVDDAAMTTSSQYAVDAQVDEFLAWWTSTPGPRMAWLCLSAAHDPWDVPPGYAPDPLLTAREQYLRVVSYADARIAEVLAAVSANNTFVAILGDNGTPNAARPPGSPFNQWKFTTFEGGVRVPAVIAGPGVRKGATAERLVSLADLPATLAELAGLILADDLPDSVSFADELGAWTGAAPRQFLLTERYASSYDDQAIVEPEWKYRLVDKDGPAGPKQPVETFEFCTSPGVTAQLQPPDAVKDRLRAELASLPPRMP